jgi:hypothetical protein
MGRFSDRHVQGLIWTDSPAGDALDGMNVRQAHTQSGGFNLHVTSIGLDAITNSNRRRSDCCQTKEKSS